MSLIDSPITPRMNSRKHPHGTSNQYEFPCNSLTQEYYQLKLLRLLPINSYKVLTISENILSAIQRVVFKKYLLQCFVLCIILLILKEELETRRSIFCPNSYIYQVGEIGFKHMQSLSKSIHLASFFYLTLYSQTFVFFPPVNKLYLIVLLIRTRKKRENLCSKQLVFVLLYYITHLSSNEQSVK